MKISIINNALIILYVVVIVSYTLHLNGFLLNLEEYCNCRFNSWTIYKLLLALFLPYFLFERLFKKKKYKGLGIIYITPLLMLFTFFYLDNIKTTQIFQSSKNVIDKAIILRKTHSKLSWYVVAKFEIQSKTVKTEFKINGHLWKEKKIGDTILIKYIKECPNINTDFNFTPSNKEIKFYEGGRLIRPET
ncbi:hypothetical protein NBT05_06365 [Aquimarina sp. ERC-38]|uniref:hypothetical protein n=1 Tax=Aquimarina sp. ERC-38 TaxID=2949996 RepID=UPI0022471A7F|nr:hypothetical protein [Aquimarina sp. ERC-38]UZO82092.1 hypothetical protein NBT05_06365 [Aquimarina sp. ERC-38]